MHCRARSSFSSNASSFWRHKRPLSPFVILVRGQCKVMTFVSLEVWLLYICRLERKAYCLSEFRPSSDRPKDIYWVSHFNLIYLKRWTFWGVQWLSYWTLLLIRWQQGCKQLKSHSESGTYHRTDRKIDLQTGDHCHGWSARGYQINGWHGVWWSWPH